MALTAALLLQWLTTHVSVPGPDSFAAVREPLSAAAGSVHGNDLRDVNFLVFTVSPGGWGDSAQSLVTLPEKWNCVRTGNSRKEMSFLYLNFQCCFTYSY